MTENLSEASIHVAMSRVMADITAIKKNQRNTHFNFNFRGIDDVMNALHGPLTKHGVFYVPEVLDHEIIRGDKQWHATLRVRYTFFGPLGDSVSASVTAEGLDSSDKAATKAMSTALKYALLQVFCIPTEEQREMDPDRSGENWSPQSTSKAQSSPEEPQAATRVADDHSRPVSSAVSAPSSSEGVASDAGEVAAGAPSENVYELIANAMADKKLSTKVITTANRVALDMDAIPEKGISRQTVLELPENVLAAIAQKMNLKQESLV